MCLQKLECVVMTTSGDTPPKTVRRYNYHFSLVNIFLNYLQWPYLPEDSAISFKPISKLSPSTNANDKLTHPTVVMPITSVRTSY